MVSRLFFITRQEHKKNNKYDKRWVFGVCLQKQLIFRFTQITFLI
jgi:hypothetical protein